MSEMMNLRFMLKFYALSIVYAIVSIFIGLESAKYNYIGIYKFKYSLGEPQTSSYVLTLLAPN
ncbi:MAG: hypothetical protein ACI9MS_000650 [Glaciecola sp.]|jgi:hypothetical protein